MTTSLLPLELVFADGHLTDVGIATLADGEDALVPAEVHAHVHSCPECSSALGREALHSMALGELVRAAIVGDAHVDHRALHAAAPPRVPMLAVAAGSLMSVVGLLLGSIGSPLSFGDRFRDARGFVTAIAHATRAALGAELPPAVTFASAAFLVTVALLVMRASPIVRGRNGDRPLPS